MKKILFAIAIVLMMVVSANAQRNDGFFNNWNDLGGFREGEDPLFPGLPGLTQDPTNDVNAPLGSGLLVLTALGGAYAFVRRQKLK